MRINSAKDLDVYKKAYELAMKVFEVTKGFPPEERFALTGQVRRSSRSVCLNLREAWAKRRYEPTSLASLPIATVKTVRRTLLWISPETVATSHPISMRS